MSSEVEASGSRAGPDHREAEWQFDVPDARAVEKWLDEGTERGNLSVDAGEVLRLTDTYLDTDDWRLYRAGFALRIRKRGKQAETTMKSLASESEVPGLRNRREISEPIEDSNPSGIPKARGPVGERVRSLIGRHGLKPIFEIRTRRVTYALNADGERIGEVSVDDTSIPLEDDHKPFRIQRVEVETELDLLSKLEPFVGELRAGFELSPGASSKFRSGLTARGHEPPEPPEFGPTGVDSSLTLGEVAFAVMREQFAKFLAHEAGTRLGDDPEELHDMRVASRRLRAAMQIFKDALPVRFRQQRDEVKHFANILGEVRDLDVQVDRVRAWISGAAPEDREHLGEFASVLEKRRSEARERMLEELDSDRYESFVEDFGDALRRGPSSRTRAAGQPVLAAAPDLVQRRYRKVRKLGDKLSEDSPAESYHELRKRGKKLRYALEFLSPIYGKSAGKMVDRLKTLQDVLGDHQDAIVSIEQLREVGADGELSPRTTFVLGRTAHRRELEAEELRSRFPKVYGKIRGKRWKKLEKAMEDRRPRSETGES